MKRTASQKVMIVIYTAMAFGMYYASNTYFSLGGIIFEYRYLWAAAILVFSVCVFLVTTDLDRALRLLKLSALVCLPFMWKVFASIPLWVSNFDDFTVIRRGLFNELYVVLVVLAMAGMLYSIGEDAIWCNLAAMIVPNFLIMLNAIRGSGIGQYLSELRTAIVTFAGTVGPVISEMEIHELTFAFGFYVLYIITNAKKSWRTPLRIGLLAGSVFFFLSGFKRIGIFAVIIAVLVFLLLEFLSSRGKRGKWLLTWSGIVAAALMLLYILMVDRGLLVYLRDELGIDLMGRESLLTEIKEYFYFGPGYFGYGTGFTLELVNSLREAALHNDILVLYVDLGFWGFIAWMLLYFPVKSNSIAKKYGIRNGILAFAYGVYLVISALTDNTTNYTYVTGTMALLTMACIYSDSTVSKEEKV